MKRARMAWAAALAAASGSVFGSAWARQGAMEEAARRAADAALSPTERLEALERASALRRERLAGLGAGEERARLLVDHAEGLLARLAWDGSDVTAMFGVPPAGSVEGTRATASEASASAREALEWLSGEIARVETGGGAADEAGRSRFAGLLELRDARAPWALARALAVEASLETDGVRARELASGVVAAARSARGEGAEADARRAVLEGQAARVRGESGEARALFERAVVRGGSPATLLEASLGRALAAAESGSASAARAGLAGALAREPFVEGGRAQALPMLLAADAQFQIGRLEAERAADGASRARALREAYGAYVRYWQREDVGLDEPRRRGLVYARLQAAAPADVAAYADLHAIVALAKASQEAQRRGGFETAVALLEGATERGSARLAELGPLGADALWDLAALRIAESRTLENAEYLGGAVEALRRIVEEYPGSPRAREAAEAGASSGQAWARGTRDAAAQQAAAGYEAMLRTALGAFPDHRSAAAWRFELARLKGAAGDGEGALALLDEIEGDSAVALEARVAALSELARRMESADSVEEAQGAASALRDRASAVVGALEAQAGASEGERRAQVDRLLGAALAHLAQGQLATGESSRASATARRAVEMARANGDAATEALALTVRARAAALLRDWDGGLYAIRDMHASYPDLVESTARVYVDAVGAYADERQAVGDTEETVRATRDYLITSGAFAMDAADKAGRADDAARWRVLVGMALTRLGKGAEGKAMLLKAQETMGESERLTMLIAEAHLAANETAEAFELFRGVAQAMEDRQEYGPQYWRCWSRMLEILLFNNGDGSRTERIRQEIARLRALDAGLGGEPSRGVIERIEAAVGR